MSRRAVAVAGLVLFGAALVTLWPAPHVEVPAGTDAQAVIDRAPAGATVELGPGTHQGPLEVHETLRLVGEDAEVVAPLDADAALHVTAPGVVVEGLSVTGGWTGVDLDDAGGAVLRDVEVSGADAQGVRVYKASALLEDVSVAGLRDPHAQGIEVLSAPDVVVRESHVTGGKVGIVGHLSDTVFERNVVTGTSLAGVVIREMGTGIARDNVVRDATGAGLYCGDMSRCAFERNVVEGVGAAPGGRSAEGWGLVVNYRATASSESDALAGAAGETVALSHSRIVAESPLELGEPLGAIALGASSTFLGLLVLAVLYLAARRLAPAVARGGSVAPAAGAGIALLLVGAVIQSFHMLEHVVQLSRVYADGVPSRGALVGSLVDTEWVHLVYNAAVLAGLGSVLHLRRRGWTAGGNDRLGDRLVLAVGLLQGYHVVEHVVKVIQHETTGAKVNPGLLGNEMNLVLLHFGLNAAVYLGFVAAV
ncbi:MAG TPA: right-handed parallel beta-helix repeat-containing protein, partial [Actinomycetota bacterium]|nr:right-handed parallel beta-helix repeat-containing protein [Actinomycetota bacterium]